MTPEPSPVAAIPAGCARPTSPSPRSPSTSSAPWARPPGSRNRSTTKRRRSAGLEKSTSRSPAMPADEGERWRVFLAIETPVPVREALTGPLDGLQPLREAIRTNAVDRMHLTLHFLGHQPRPVVDLLQETLAAVVAR